METSSLRPAVATITVATSQRTRGIIRQPFCYRATGGDGVVADQLRGSGVRAKGAGTPPCGRADSARSASHSGRHRAVPGRRSRTGCRRMWARAVTTASCSPPAQTAQRRRSAGQNTQTTLLAVAQHVAKLIHLLHHVVDVTESFKLWLVPSSMTCPIGHGSAASAPAKSSSW